MSSDRLRYLGRVSQEEKEKKRLELKLRGLCGQVRESLDFLLLGPEGLEAEQAAQLSLELAAAHIEYKRRLAQIRALKQALGQE